jgi:hypothetical protein
MYAQGRDFNCKGASCYGIGPIPATVLTQLQQATNAALVTLKIPIKPVKVDGLIGPATVAAIVEIAKRAPGTFLVLVQRMPTPIVASQYASELVGELAAITPLAGTRPPAAPGLPVSAPGVPVQIPQSTAPQSQAPTVVTPTPFMPVGTATAVGTAATAAAAAADAAPPPRDYGKYWIAAGAAFVIATVIAVSVYTRARLRESGAQPG